MATFVLHEDSRPEKDMFLFNSHADPEAYSTYLENKAQEKGHAEERCLPLVEVEDVLVPNTDY